MEDKNNQPQKCYCARCFGAIEPADKVEFNGQNFHKSCCTCCVCNKIPKSLKMFYGHVFCEECFKSHVLSRLRGDMPKVYMNNCWWMQFKPEAPKVDTPEPEKPEKPEKDAEEKTEDELNKESTPTNPPKKCFCARCLQAIDNNDKVDVNGQCFHRQCCKCCCCNCTPSIPKIYFGHVFCENCFCRFVLSGNKGPSEFFSNCLQEWQNNNNFSEHVKKFMTPNENKVGPMVFMTGQHPFFNRCANNVMFGPNEPHELRQTEPKQCA